MTKNKASRSGFPARPRTIPRHDLLLARWLMGDTIPLDADGEAAIERGMLLLSLPGLPEIPWSEQQLANLLTEGDVERLRAGLQTAAK